MNKDEIQGIMLEPSIRDIYKAIDQDENLVITEVDGQLSTIICEGFGNLLVDFEEFAQHAAAGQTGFHITQNAFGGTNITSGQLATHFRNLDNYISLYDNGKTYSPHVEAAYAQIDGMGLRGCEFSRNPAELYQPLQMTGADVFNQLIERIKRECQSAEFNRALKKGLGPSGFVARSANFSGRNPHSA